MAHASLLLRGARSIGLPNCHQDMISSVYLLLVFTSAVTILVQGSCITSSGTPICCRGKQSACCGYIFDDSSNTTSSAHYTCPTLEILPLTRRSVKTCFCDEFCTTTNDCCPDYRAVCHKPVIDCVVSEWGPWSECSRQCGQGVSVRRRRINQPPHNGGQHCPVLEESKPCQGSRCVSRRVGRSGSLMLLPFVRQARAEVAHLLPSPGDVLRITRRWDMRWDERRKLYLGKLIKQNKTEQPDPDPYCAVYEITYANEACSPQNLLRQFMFGQSTNEYNYYRTAPSRAVQGRNAHPYSLHTNRIRASRRTRRRATFNSMGLGAVILGPELDFRSNWRYTWVNHGALIAEGRQICITCYPTYMREDLGFRCSGTGLLNVETRWRAVRTDDCHGRFRMITMPQRTCTCDAEATSFIFI